jgi:AraC-like DNA-binding protein
MSALRIHGHRGRSSLHSPPKLTGTLTIQGMVGTLQSMGKGARIVDRTPVAMTRPVIRNCDLDEARHLGGQIYYPHDVRVFGEPREFGLQLEAMQLGPLTLGTLSYNTEVQVRTGVLEDAYQVNIPIDGCIRTSSGDQSMVTSPRRAAVYRRDRDSLLRGWAVPCRMLAIKIDARVLELELEGLLGQPVRAPIAFNMRLDIDSGLGRQWWTIVQALASDLADINTLQKHPVMAIPLARSLMTGLLLAADFTGREELDWIEAPAQPSVVRRAVAYIDDHAEDPMTLTDIAAAAGIGVRALQHGFQVSLNKSPLTYLRDVRLSRVREDLSRADPETTGVADIAFGRGFSHLGRFAGLYRQVYGESPSQTLRASASGTDVR